jgi:peptidoglycan hydrolase CwlO-like protein
MTPNDRFTQIEIFSSDLARQTDRIDATTQYLVRMASHHSDQFEFVIRKMTGFNEKQEAMQADIEQLKAGQAKLEAGQAKLEAEVADLKSGQQELRIAVTQLTTNVDQLTANVGQILTILTSGNSKS